MTTLRSVLALGLLVAFVGAGFAAEDAEEKKKGKKDRPARQAKLIKIPDSITLSDEQKTKLEAIEAEYGPKVATSRKEALGLTKEQREQMMQIRKDAKASGEKVDPKSLMDQIGVTAEQQEAMKASRKAAMDLRHEALEKSVAVLNTDQVEAFKKANRMRTPKEKKNKKKPSGDV
ncbi:hypothetical protein [Stratiformator vulcanicus]|uniref:LTXXQ motif protein n=1 Tax=Stratiformator vulcanicus TaxID=2527980 RepID=A0A517QZN8_9PLAN|nr:hypothetical protein [Stratiformator vulcanicus]QDT37078.1 hypothetical protein Pan189_14450 [Stratiformator vulcanicus]